jgi:hypothetical protein
MLPVSLCCSFLIVHKINIRVNRRDNQEWTTQRHWQHGIHKTQDKINTRVNRRMLPVPLCCSFLIVPSVYTSVYFVLCLVYPMLPVSLDCSQSRMNNTETLTTSDTQDTGQNKHSILFALVFILSCVLCIRCCQCLCFVHSWLSLLFTLGVNRRDNQEWKTQKHWQYRMHKTQGKINTRVNRRNNKEWTKQQCLCVFYTWFSILFALVFILSCVLCIRCCQCLWV